MGRRDVPLLLTLEEAVDLYQVTEKQVKSLSPAGMSYTPKKKGVPLYSTKEVQDIERSSKQS